MSKRTPRGPRPASDRDFWPTPPEAVEPLLPLLGPGTRFLEPCAGDGALVRALESAGHVCVAASDLYPRDSRVTRFDACDYEFEDKVFDETDAIITNPPWSRATVVPIIERLLAADRPLYLLTPLDWIANLWFAPFARAVTQIAPIGRVSWTGTGTGFENSTWLRLDVDNKAGFLHPRQKRGTQPRRS